MNLYQRLSIRQLGAHDIARVAFRASGAMKPQVNKPDVASLFNRSAVARGLIDGRADAMSYVLGGSNVNGLSGFEGFAAGAVGISIFPGGPAFAEEWSTNDFSSKEHFTNWVRPYLSQVGMSSNDLDWEPPSQILKERAGRGLIYLQGAEELGNAEAANILNATMAELKALIEMADQGTRQGVWTPTGSSGHRNIGTEVQRYQTFNSIVKAMKKLATYADLKLPESTAREFDFSDGGSSAGGTTSFQVDGGGNITPNRSRSSAGSPEMAANRAAATASSNMGWILPAAVGVGVIGLAVVIIKSKGKK